MKKFICVLCSLIFVLSLVACGKKTAGSDNGESGKISETSSVPSASKKYALKTVMENDDLTIEGVYASTENPGTDNDITFGKSLFPGVYAKNQTIHFYFKVVPEKNKKFTEKDFKGAFAEKEFTLPEDNLYVRAIKKAGYELIDTTVAELPGYYIVKFDVKVPADSGSTGHEVYLICNGVVTSKVRFSSYVRLENIFSTTSSGSNPFKDVLSTYKDLEDKK